MTSVIYCQEAKELLEAFGRVGVGIRGDGRKPLRNDVHVCRKLLAERFSKEIGPADAASQGARGIAVAQDEDLHARQYRRRCSMGSVRA